MTKERAQGLLTKFPYWAREELTPDEKAELWRGYNNFVKGFSRGLSFKTVLEWIINNEI